MSGGAVLGHETRVCSKTLNSIVWREASDGRAWSWGYLWKSCPLLLTHLTFPNESSQLLGPLVH